MEKNTINSIITNTGRVASGISLVIALTMDTVVDVARRLTGIAFFGIQAAYVDVAQRIIFAIAPVLFLLFSLIPKKSIARVLGIFATAFQLLIARQFTVNVIDLIGRRAGSLKTATVWYVIFGVIAIISCIAGFFADQIHAVVNSKLSTKKFAQRPQAAQPTYAPQYAAPQNSSYTQFSQPQAQTTQVTPVAQPMQYTQYRQYAQPIAAPSNNANYYNPYNM